MLKYNIVAKYINTYLKYTFSSKHVKASKGFVKGTPIKVRDLSTKESLVFTSISEAARYLDTYPKTI